MLFIPSQATDRTVYLVQADKNVPFSYTYQITGYTLRGQPIAGDSPTTANTSLAVKMHLPERAIGGNYYAKFGKDACMSKRMSGHFARFPVMQRRIERI